MYCALYPEDYKIEREELLELLTLEGIIQENESRMTEIDEGNSILNKLINQCLLEGGENYGGSSCVKMHDLVRDMTLQIDDLHSQYLAISDTKMRKISHVKLSEDLLKIHISTCSSLNASPICPKLTTFILRDSILPNIPNSFFQHFKALKVLILSNIKSLEVLPDSISNLVNLVGLFLRHCTELRYVPTFEMLKNLQSLEISLTSLRDIPKSLEKLNNLRYLNLISSTIKVLPPKIIPKLSNLRRLVCSSSTEVSASELMDLKNLEMLHGGFRDVHNLRAFVKHREQEGSPLIDYNIEVFSVCNLYSLDWMLERNSFNKVVKLADCILCIPSRENDLYLLPKDVQALIMDKIYDLTSLCAITSLNYAKDLQYCHINSCNLVRELITTSSCCSFALQSLQTLRLFNLENMKSLIGRGKAPCNVFPCLQELEIFDCQRIKVLFDVGFLSNLKSLEKLIVTSCWKLKEIIGESLDNDKDLNEDMTCVTLPKLRYLCLFHLLNLKYICPPTRRLICKSLKEIRTRACPELEQCVYASLEDNEDFITLSSQPMELKLQNNRTD